MAGEPPEKSVAGRYPVITVIAINIVVMFVLMTWQDLAMLRPPRYYFTIRLPWQGIINLLFAVFAAHNKQRKLMLAHAFFFLLPMILFFISMQG